MDAQLIVKIVAALGAAAWAFTLLFVLRKPALATTGLRKVQLQLNRLQLQAELERQKGISINIEPTVHPGPDNKSYIICAVVELANAGSRIKKIEWTDDLPFSVRRVRFPDGDGKPVYDEPVRLHVPLTLDPKAKAVSRVIRSGGKETISFALKVSQGLSWSLSVVVPSAP